MKVFLSGLPRSGSTLLSSILNQNPNIYSGHSSPVLELIINSINTIDQSEHYKAYPDNQACIKVLSNIMNNYYADRTESIIIDKNRAWTCYIDLIKKFITPDVKIICCIRSLEDILKSFLKLCNKESIVDGKLNFIDKNLVMLNLEINDDNRCKYLLTNNSVLGEAYQGLRNAIKFNMDNLLLVEYNELVNNPYETMIKVYKFLNVKSYSHNFKEIQTEKVNDVEVYGLNNMHYVRSEVKKEDNMYDVSDEIRRILVNISNKVDRV